MCDPISLTVAAVGVAGGAYQARQAKKATEASIAAQQQAQGDAAAERARAEAEAAQRANAQLADTNRRRREQGSLIAKGAPQFTLGDSQLQPGQSPLGGVGQRMSRAVTASRSSLITRGAPAAGGGFGGGGGGRFSDANTALM